MVVFQFEDYKRAFLQWVSEAPKGGHGQFRKLSQSLGVSSVFITQVFRGDRDLNLDQALDTAAFMSLTDLETDYFLLLVQEARAAGPRLRARLAKRRLALKTEARDLKKQIAQDIEMGDEAKALFYSHWHYSAVRLLSSIREFSTVEAIAARLQIPSERVAQVITFLGQNGLIVPAKHGWKMGPKVTHLEAGSPYILSRQVQWRTKGFERMATASPDDLFYTGPMVLDEKTFLEVRQLLADAIRRSLDRIRAADETLLACLNVDWFHF